MKLKIFICIVLCLLYCGFTGCQISNDNTQKIEGYFKNGEESYLKEGSIINNKKVPYYYFERYGEESDLQNNEYISSMKTSYKYDQKCRIVYRDYLDGVEIIKCDIINSVINIPETINNKKVLKLGGYIDEEYMEADPINYSLRSCFDSYAYTIIEEIKLPASVKEIIYGTFDIESLKKLEVDKSNPYYSSKDGILYDKSGKIKLCVPPNHHSRNKD